jgi:hypothetical protein
MMKQYGTKSDPILSGFVTECKNNISYPSDAPFSVVNP